METMASTWMRDPCDFIDPGESESVWASQCDFHSSSPDGLMPQLQRNKLLQESLQQKEEELLRLQQENNKLREFLNSSFVKNLEQKAKRLTADGRRRLKRNLEEEPTVQPSHQLSKRVCRNLTAQFCCEGPEVEPNLDHWVLRMLGLKDADTIDNCSPHTSSCSSLDSSFSQSSPPLFCGFGVSADCGPATSPQSSPVPSAQHITAAAPQTFSCSPAPQTFSCPPAPQTFSCPPAPQTFSCPPASQTFNCSPTRQIYSYSPTPQTCSTSALSQVQASCPELWSPGTWASLQDKVLLSPPREPIPFVPVSSSSPSRIQVCTPDCGGGAPPSPSTGAHSRSDLAFSMSLSPSSSVKTQTFPQGQAFTRKDPQGRWSFTWMPRQP